MDDLRNNRKTLTQKVINSGIWVFSIRMTGKAFTFIRLIILARLLSPEMFGILGIALLFLSSLEHFTEIGLRKALIQKKSISNDYLDVAWTSIIIRSFLISAIVYFSAPYIARFFNEPSATSVIQVIGATVLLQGFTNVGIIYFQKELEFNKEFIYQFSIIFADFIVVIPLAFVLRNVWALVFGLLAGNTAGVISSYLLHKYKPRFRFSFKKNKELFNYGKWILGSSITNFLTTEGDDFLVGKILGSTSLGFYQMAYRISNITTTELTHVINKVTFPTFSKLQENVEKLKEGFLKVLKIISFFAFPMAGLIFILANDFTIIFLGDKWAPIIPAVQTLAIGGLLRSIGSASGPLFQGVGKPRIIAILQAVRLIFIIAAIYPAILYLGILGAALTITLTALLTFPIQTFVVIRTIKSSVKEYSKLLIIPFTGTIVFILAIILYRYFNPEVMNLFIFIIAIIFSLLMYGVIIFISEKFFGYHIKEELLSSFLKRLIKRDGRKKKIKVLMVPHYSNPYQGLLKDSLIKKSVEVYFGSSEHIFSNIRSVLSSWKPQIIHVHWLTRFLNSNGLFEQIVKSSLFIIEIMLIKLIGIKIVWTVHNITSHEPKSINIEIFYRKIFAKLCNRIIVHCTFAKEEIVRLFNTKKNKIETIPMGNFVGKYKNKLSRYEARKILDVGKDELVFLNIGKIRDYKGIFDLTYAFQKNRNSGIKIFIIGKVSDKEIRKRLNVSADQNKNIILKLEYIPDEDIQIYLNASDLLILPYKNILTSSTAILGMSFQKAVIAPSIGCIPELLAKQQRDLLYDLDEKNGLEKAISRALYLKDKLPEIGQQNYKEIEKYTWNYAASKTKNLYEDII